MTQPPLSLNSLPVSFLSAAGLRARGLSERDLRAHVRAGALLRVRRGRYLAPSLPDDVLRAARLGGRLDCVSLLRSLGVFVLHRGTLHIQVSNGSSRLPDSASDVIRHWRQSRAEPTHVSADVIEALAQACRCQPAREAIATLDSAWHLGLVDEAAIAEVFSLLPRRLQVLRSMLDQRSESGPETIMRLLLRGLAEHVEVQVVIPGVGRVDFVVDGWLIVECDSEEHHSGWPAQKRDRRRDLAAAALGYTTVRPIAEDILYHRDSVIIAIKRCIAARNAVANSSTSARQGRRRPSPAAAGGMD